MEEDGLRRFIMFKNMNLSGVGWETSKAAGLGKVLFSLGGG